MNTWNSVIMNTHKSTTMQPLMEEFISKGFMLINGLHDEKGSIPMKCKMSGSNVVHTTV